MDVNEHVNNVKYIESLYEGLSLKFLTSHHLTDLEINFLSEALYDDNIAVYSRATGDATYRHSLKSDERDQEFCRARTRWRRCG
ncbi:hypothetical protein A2V82_01090 [candidate division KSB1 bacterium RBG_16_48_16]|nr:MAG: hypothetical protein A2V82_01090 [candidate division KSB1 bacterium RBG_16_48_16]